MEWLALIVPIIAVVVLRVFYARQMTWWEFGLPLLACAIVIALGKMFAEKVTVQATEYWGGWMTKAVYFERWDEEVPCCHPKYRTEYYECGTSKAPATCSRQVFDGYEHAYDVDDHPEYWQIEDSNGFVFNIDGDEFERLARLFHSRQFADMHRHYHSIDGNAYVATWNSDRSTLQPVTSKHSYENRVAHARGVYAYPEVNRHATPVVDYPDVDNYTVSSILGRKVTTKQSKTGATIAKQIPTKWSGSEDIDTLNAILGAKKKIRLWVIIWEGDLDRQVGFDQEAYWKGSNKNELVICVNVHSQEDPTVNWCHVFSWSQSEELKTAIKGFVAIDNTKLNLHALAQFLEPELTSKWTKRNWHDFDFLSVEPPTWAMWMIWILTILTTGGVSFYCVSNQFDGETSTRR